MSVFEALDPALSKGYKAARTWIRLAINRRSRLEACGLYVVTGCNLRGEFVRHNVQVQH